MKMLGRALKYRWLQVLRLRDDPHRVALGVACGIWAGSFPPLGQMILAWVLALGLRANVAAALIATWWSNPLTYAPAYFLFYQIGLLFCPGQEFTFELFAQRIALIDGLTALMNLGADVLQPLFLGCFLAAITLSPMAYYCTYQILYKRQQRREALCP